jgi:hypothetical protein
MRVRTGRFRRGDQGEPRTHGMMRASHPERSMLPNGKALTGCLAHTGVIGASILPAVERPPASLVLPDIESSGVRVYAGVFQPPACGPLLRPLLTSRRLAPAESPQIGTRCVPARPPHFPPEADPPVAEPAGLNRVTSRCCARSSYRARPSMRFQFVGPPVSSSLPPRSVALPKLASSGGYFMLP